jgi:hypothetical protein
LYFSHPIVYVSKFCRKQKPGRSNKEKKSPVFTFAKFAFFFSPARCGTTLIERGDDADLVKSVSLPPSDWTEEDTPNWCISYARSVVCNSDRQAETLIFPIVFLRLSRSLDTFLQLLERVSCTLCVI